MSSSPRTLPRQGAFSRRFTSYAGLFFDEFDHASAWIRERATVRLPPLSGVRTVLVQGVVREHPAAQGMEKSIPRLRIAVNGTVAGRLSPNGTGTWELRIPVPATETTTLTLDLLGVIGTNLLAWLGRVTGFGPWQRFRAQNKNRQLRITTIA